MVPDPRRGPHGEAATRGDPRPPIVTPALAVDGVVIHGGQVVLVLRRHEPFAGRWALPGGFMMVGEAPEEAVRREVLEETGLRTRVQSLVGVYGRPGRDTRGHVVSLVFRLAAGRRAPQAGDDAARARWWPLRALPPLAFDHATILRDALRAGPKKPTAAKPRRAT